MKKLFTMLTLAVVLCGCTQAEPIIDTPTPEPTVSAQPSPYLSDARPIAVMIDNDDESARPPAGVEDAYMVYEITVEGAATRMMALFKNYSVEKVGPVRSARHYFLDYALENDAIYAHAGQSPQAGRDINALKMADINGLDGLDGQYFHRDYSQTSGWHTLFTGTNRLAEFAQTQGYRNTTDVALYPYNLTDEDISGDSAESFLLPYAPFYQLSFKYNAKDKVYERYINGKAHKAQSGVTLSAKNVIVLYMDNYNLNDGTNAGRQELDNLGSGKGFYMTNGKYKEITWSKASRRAKTILKDKSGTEITLNPGVTYVQIIPESKSIILN